MRALRGITFLYHVPPNYESYDFMGVPESDDFMGVPESAVPESAIDLRTTVQIDLASRLMSVEGLSRVQVLGGDEPAFIVQLQPAALTREHLTIGDVTSALARHNQVVAADFIDRGSREYLIRYCMT